jgi:hypothetical protein
VPEPAVGPQARPGRGRRADPAARARDPEKARRGLGAARGETKGRSQFPSGAQRDNLSPRMSFNCSARKWSVSRPRRSGSARPREPRPASPARPRATSPDQIAASKQFRFSSQRRCGDRACTVSGRRRFSGPPGVCPGLLEPISRHSRGSVHNHRQRNGLRNRCRRGRDAGQTNDLDVGQGPVATGFATSHRARAHGGACGSS